MCARETPEAVQPFRSLHFSERMFAGIKKYIYRETEKEKLRRIRGHDNQKVHYEDFL